MHRFFVEHKKGDHFKLSDETLKHIKVARLTNEPFLCNFQGIFYKCILEDKNAKILEQLDINHEYAQEVIVALPIIKIKRYEWMLQKATELGATTFIPSISEFTDGKIVQYELKNKEIRFNEIIKNAAEQSFRNVIPNYEQPQKFEQIIDKYSGIKTIYLAHEKEEQNDLNALKTNSIIFVGPEGGFSDKEVEYALNKGAKIISLGKRILRAETAVIASLAKVKE